MFATSGGIVNDLLKQLGFINEPDKLVRAEMDGNGGYNAYVRVAEFRNKYAVLYGGSSGDFKGLL